MAPAQQKEDNNMTQYIVEALLSDVAIVYNAMYKLFGPCLYVIVAGFVLYKVYPRNMTLQYLMSRFEAKMNWWINKDSLEPNERAWLNSVEPIFFQRALDEKDWEAAKKMKKLAANRNELFEFLMEYYKLDYIG